MIPLRLLWLSTRLLPQSQAFAVCQKSTRPAAAPAMPDGLVLVRLAEDRLDELARLHQKGDFDREQALKSFAQQQLCLAAERHGAIVAYAWLCPRMTMFDLGLVKPEASDVYCSETIVAATAPAPDIGQRFDDAMLHEAFARGWQTVYRIVDLDKRWRIADATRAGWQVEGAVLVARGWRSSLPRLSLALGNVYPIRLVQLLESGPPPETEIALGDLALRTLKRPFQWLRHGVFHLRALNVVTWVLSWFGEARLIFIYRRDLTKPLAPCQARVPVESGWATEADAQEIADLEREGEKRVRIYRNRLRRGDRCFVARIDGRIVATNWIRFNTAWSWTDIRVEDGDIYMTDGYTAPKWRGQGIHPLTNYKMLEYARDQGYRASYSILDATNANSWITMAHLGWELTGVLISFETKNAKAPRFWCVGGSPYPMLIDGRKNAVDAKYPVD